MRRYVLIMIHPIFCYLGVTLAFVSSLFLFVRGWLDADTYFYVPLVLLIGFYTAYSVVTDKDSYLPRTWRQVLPKALGKTLMWGGIIWGVIQFYGAHPLYRDFTVDTRRFMEHLLKVFWVAGPIYFILAEKFRYNRDNCIGDPYLRFLSLLKQLVRLQFRCIGRRIIKRPYRRFIMMVLLRIHYIPIMLYQVHQHVVNLTYSLQAEDMQWNLTAVLWSLIIPLAWLIDSNNGAMGYFWESWFTKTRFRDMDPFPLHWIVVLCCYPPFINLAGQFVPFPDAPAQATLLFNSHGLNTTLEIILTTVLVLYMLSGCALWFSTSNLCYKKIQTRGPYGIVRHPATTCKLIFFFLAFFRYRESFCLTGILCYGVWFTVYISRALVEERFLRQYSEYRTYMKKTRYRFIPGIC